MRLHLKGDPIRPQCRCQLDVPIFLEIQDCLSKNAYESPVHTFRLTIGLRMIWCSLPMFYLELISHLLSYRIQEVSSHITNQDLRTFKPKNNILIHKCGRVSSCINFDCLPLCQTSRRHYVSHPLEEWG